MFAESIKLKILDFKSFETSELTNMGAMFQGCESLASINLDSFDTNQVTSMTLLFLGCSSLNTLNINHFVTKKLKDMSYRKGSNNLPIYSFKLIFC